MLYLLTQTDRDKIKVELQNAVGMLLTAFSLVASKHREMCTGAVFLFESFPSCLSTIVSSLVLRVLYSCECSSEECLSPQCITVVSPTHPFPWAGAPRLQW